MNGNDGHNPLEAILSAMQSIGMKPDDVDQMAALLDPILGDGKGFTRTGRIEGHPRLSQNVWRLIIKALLACFPEEQK